MTEPAQVLVPDAHVAERRAPRWRGPLAIAGVIAVAFLGWQLLDTRNELRALQTDAARRLGEGSAISNETRAVARGAQDTAQSLQGRVASLESRIVDAESQQSSLEKLYQELSRTRDERGLQEAEQAISIASQQLQLAGNVPAALTALQAADARLASMDQARLLPLRRLVTRDIDRLKALPLADVSGMALQLETVLGRVDSLPLAFARSPAAAESAPVASASAPVANKPAAAKSATRTTGQRKGATPSTTSAPAAAPVADEPGWTDTLGAVVSDFMNGFRALVRIERVDAPDGALLAPEQAAYLRENIRMRLLSARLALLQRDGRIFAEDTQQARLWIERYFDMRDRSVASLTEELRQMESARLVVELPQLTETEAALRRLRLSR
ncbi:uroporphyrinogen-III C-methyltransferase [Uliginosibacterium sp. H3]|uniref:Uroporphyrinogen-III C-methyltransferase n=1 Tax=Uliginosibacterium silvisoli TaxID=3114758 RepID=A0ABU6JYC9_9RHOO|nr:uroporphyrinogen-III C-methyltransferase [Uliginosibacterium sp. H3]